MAERADAPKKKESSYRVYGLDAQRLKTYKTVKAYSADQASFKAKVFHGLVQVLDSRPM